MILRVREEYAILQIQMLIQLPVVSPVAVQRTWIVLLLVHVSIISVLGAPVALLRLLPVSLVPVVPMQRPTVAMPPIPVKQVQYVVPTLLQMGQRVLVQTQGLILVKQVFVFKASHPVEHLQQKSAMVSITIAMG